MIRSDGVPRRESEVTKRAVEGDVTENLRIEKYEYRERMGEEEKGEGEGEGERDIYLQRTAKFPGLKNTSTEEGEGGRLSTKASDFDSWTRTRMS